MTVITLKEAEDFYNNSFSPWIKALDISFTAIGRDSATLRIPPRPT